MGENKAFTWVESYLYQARGHRALEQSVYAAGERAGFSERRLRRAGRALGVSLSAGCWELPSARSQALDSHHILALAPAPHSLPSVGVLTRTPVRLRRAA